jgi:hypothetical protein
MVSPTSAVTFIPSASYRSFIGTPTLPELRTKFKLEKDEIIMLLNNCWKRPTRVASGVDGKTLLAEIDKLTHSFLFPSVETLKLDVLFPFVPLYFPAALV